VFTARYWLIAYMKQIVFRLLKVNWEFIGRLIRILSLPSDIFYSFMDVSDKPTKEFSRVQDVVYGKGG
jgi:hypothetical protein